MNPRPLTVLLVAPRGSETPVLDLLVAPEVAHLVFVGRCLRAEEAGARLGMDHHVDVVAIAAPHPSGDTSKAVRTIRAAAPRVPVVVVGTVPDVGTDVIRAGADDYVSAAGGDSTELVRVLQRALERAVRDDRRESARISECSRDGRRVLDALGQALDERPGRTVARTLRQADRESFERLTATYRALVADVVADVTDLTGTADAQSLAEMLAFHEADTSDVLRMHDQAVTGLDWATVTGHRSGGNISHRLHDFLVDVLSRVGALYRSSALAKGSEIPAPRTDGWVRTN